jgi:hypothetical protein
MSWSAAGSRAMKRKGQPVTDDEKYRRELAKKLDELLERIEAAREAGDITFLEAADRILDAIRQQANLLHLYAPEKVEVVFVEEFTDPLSPGRARKPNPAMLEAIREVVAREHAEKKAAQNELDEL